MKKNANDKGTLGIRQEDEVFLEPLGNDVYVGTKKEVGLKKDRYDRLRGQSSVAMVSHRRLGLQSWKKEVNGRYASGCRKETKGSLCRGLAHSKLTGGEERSG